MNGYHKTCGARFSTVVTVTRVVAPDWIGFVASDGALLRPRYVGDTSAFLYDCPCGKQRVARRVAGKVNAAKVCDSRCMGSTGHQCECSCGGKNHGASHQGA